MISKIICNKGIYFDDASICRQQGMQYRMQDTTQAISSDAGIKLYPNPTSDLLNLQFESEPLTKVHIRISNLLGQTIYSKTHAPSALISLSMSDISSMPGLYLIQVSSSDQVINFKSKFVYEK